MSWLWRMMQKLKRNWLVSSKWNDEFDEFSPEYSKISNICTLMGFFLIKVYNVWAKKLQMSYVWWLWRLIQILKQNWLLLSKMARKIWQKFVQMLKNSDFILESEMVELNNQFKIIRLIGCSVKTLFYHGNKWIAQLAKHFTYITESLLLMCRFC